VPAEAGLGALRVLELDDLDALDRLLAHAEEPGGHLRDHVGVVRVQVRRVPPLAGAGEGVPDAAGVGLADHRRRAHRAVGHPAAVPRHVDGDLPALALVELEPGVDLLRGQLLRSCAAPSAKVVCSVRFALNH